MTATPSPPPFCPARRVEGRELSRLLDREWLTANGLGGYACGTVSGAATRRYHGLLIAAHPAPVGRVMAFNHLEEHFRSPDYVGVAVGGSERPGGALDFAGADVLTEFRLECGLPVWRYEFHGHVVEKRLFMPHNQNTVHIRYDLLTGAGPVRVKLRPSVHFRGHDDHVSAASPEPYTLTAIERRYELRSASGPWPTLRLKMSGDATSLTLDSRKTDEILYRIEESRGYEGVGVLWSPGVFRATLAAGVPVVLSASTESWDRLDAISPLDAFGHELERRERLMARALPEAREGLGRELVLAADQFIITPGTRASDQNRAHASGDEARTVIAGYHWFTDWGRDTMIALPGLALTTGRCAEAGCILRTFAGHVRDGLIPNYFPDKENEGVYHTADATLWFFNAVDAYSRAAGEQDTLRQLFPILAEIVRKHLGGTRFGIGVDPADGLLRQGAEGYQLTWMDAKCGDWVVTPRRGKAVEINALWYNTLMHMAGWGREFDHPEAADWAAAAEQCRASFNRRFWCEAEQGLYDVIDGEAGDDAACRPNQLFAISLPHPVLDKSRWAAVVATCEKRLLTPVGMRSLAPGHAEYKARYFGDLRSRDAAYHQGTVWGWLIGPFVDAYLKTHPGRPEEARRFLTGFDDHLSEACIGTISEVFDAEGEYTARGCVAQAWSVAEVLRCWVATAPKG